MLIWSFYQMDQLVIVEGNAARTAITLPPVERQRGQQQDRTSVQPSPASQQENSTNDAVLQVDGPRMARVPPLVRPNPLPSMAETTKALRKSDNSAPQRNLFPSRESLATPD